MPMQPYTQPPPYFGQWGEDRWLVENLVIPASGVFVDIGAGDGVRGSNSLYFENRGWTGLCVDADARNRAALSLRRCAVRICAAASVPGRHAFSMCDAKTSWSGLGDRGPGYTLTSVICHTLEELLIEADIGVIDLLSIDVEGDELDCWASFDAHLHQPGIVIIEYDDRRPQRSAEHIHDVVGRDRYELLHRTPANLILRSRDADTGRRWPNAG